MKKLLVYLRDYKKEVVFAPLFKLLEASFELIVPLVVAAIIDYGIANSDKGYIFKMCGVLVLLAIVGFVSAVTAQYFSAKAAVGFSTEVRHHLFEHIQTLSFNEMDSVGTSTLITRLTSDINQTQSGVNMVLRLFLRSPFIVFGAMIMAFTVNVKGALVFVVTIPLLSIVVFGIMALSVPRFKKVQGGLDRILGRTRENLEGARVIRAFNKEDSEAASFNEENQFLTGMQLVVGRISALMNPITFVIINVATLVVIWVGGKETFNGIITQGEVVALVNYMSQILVELVKLANLIVNVNKSIACGNRIQDIFEIKASIPNTDDKKMSDVKVDENAPMVEFSHACMRYAGSSEEALSDINFVVEKGQTIGIIGGTGSGKSTLVNMIPRFYDTSSGQVKIQGVDVKDYPIVELRDKIGMVMQKAVMFHGTIADNLRWGNENATDEELWNAVRIAQAEDVVRGKEGEIDHMIEQGGRNLSGGQKQRLTIARAIVKNPDILILDDSASALDFATDAALRKALKNMQGTKTIFIVSQRTSSIRFADKIIVLDEGKVVGMGTHKELLKSCVVYRQIAVSQLSAGFLFTVKLSLDIQLFEFFFQLVF